MGGKPQLDGPDRAPGAERREFGEEGVDHRREVDERRTEMFVVIKNAKVVGDLDSPIQGIFLKEY